MRIASGVKLLFPLLAIPAFAGTLTFLTTPGSAVDTVNWASLGPDQTPFANGAVVNSALGNKVTVGLGTQPSLGGLTSVVCSVTPTNCSWAHQTSGYTDGQTLIWMEGLDTNSNPVGTGPLTLSLLTGVDGLGAYMQTTSPGSFQSTLSIFSGATLLGSRSYSSDVAADPLFVGVIDSTAGEITRAVLSVTACGSIACDVNDFSINTLQIYKNAVVTTPEPATFGFGGVMLGLLIRSRYGRKRN